MNHNRMIPNEYSERPADISRACAFWLARIEGIGEKTIRQLLGIFGSARGIFEAPDAELSRYLNASQQRALRKARQEKNPTVSYEAFLRSGMRFVSLDDPDYPEKLRLIPDPPYALYIRGKLPDPLKPSIAVIGARMCSEYGRYMARQFGMDLARSNVQVISGMALGVDSIAQNGALQAGGTSFAVLGSGADVCYPPENRKLYDTLLVQGGVLSEYVPGTQPKRQLFPARNRIISGLADALLVIEARAKSGTLITVDMALEQGKDVYALPGRVTDRLSDGCNALIRQGAVMATSAADILEDLYGLKDCQTDKDARKEVWEDQLSFTLSPKEKQLIATLDVNPRAVSDIEAALLEKGIRESPQDLMCGLIELSLRGLIGQEGNFFYRKL